MHIAQKLGYISVFDSLKPITNTETAMSTSMTDEKYRVVAPEAMHETFMSDSEEEGEHNICFLGFLYTDTAWPKFQSYYFTI